MRELREFRVAHAEFESAGVAVAGISREAVESNRSWVRRLELPYPLLSDTEGRAGEAFGVVHRVGLGSWSVELFARTTFLADARGVIQAAWGKVKVRGHAREVLEVARLVARGGDA